MLFHQKKHDKGYKKDIISIFIAQKIQISAGYIGKEDVASAKFWTYSGNEGVASEMFWSYIGNMGVASAKFWSYSGNE